MFDLFDSNGGGTIDAQELDDALRTVDIQLTKDEITDVLASMDKDGKIMSTDTLCLISKYHLVCGLMLFTKKVDIFSIPSLYLDSLM